MSESENISLPLTPRTVGKWLYRTLTENSAVQTLVGRKVFPYKTDAPQALPWVVWDNLHVTYSRDKDSNDESVATCIVTCAAADIDSSYALGDAVRDAINQQDGCYVSDMYQNWIDEVGYIIELNVTIELY